MTFGALIGRLYCRRSWNSSQRRCGWYPL